MSNGNGLGKDLMIFEVENSSSMHSDNRQKKVLILGKGLTDGLDGTVLTVKTEYNINFSKQQE